MNLAPREHAQTVEFHQPQFINKVVDGDDAETNLTVQVERRRSSREVSVSSQSQSGGFQLSNREQTTDAARAVPESEAKAKTQSREFRGRSRFRSNSLHRKRCDPKSDA